MTQLFTTDETFRLHPHVHGYFWKQDFSSSTPKPKVWALGCQDFLHNTFIHILRAPTPKSLSAVGPHLSGITVFTQTNHSSFHTSSGVFENAAFSMRLGLSSTYKRRLKSLKTEIFLKRSFCVYV